MKIKYILALAFVIYILAKVYVTYTETKEDDHLPDHIKDMAFRMFALEDNSVIAYQPDEGN